MEITIIATAISKLADFTTTTVKLLDETRQNAIKLTEELQRIQKAITYWEEKRQITMGAKQLTIAWGENSSYWKFSSNPTSKKFSDVAELIEVCWLDIKCNVETKNLLKGRKYGVYLVFKLTNVSRGLESVVGYVRSVEAEAEAEAVKAATSLHLQSASTKRTDGWMEVKLGEIYNDDDDDDNGTVEARVFELSDDWKVGLTVAGIVFRSA